MLTDDQYTSSRCATQDSLGARNAIAYEGWERLPTEREAYRLRGKRVYCQFGERPPRREGACLAWARQWDLSRVQEVIISGEGDTAEKWLAQAPVREGKQAQRDARWVKTVAQHGWRLDWRVRLAIEEDEGRGLGCMEGKEAHLPARCPPRFPSIESGPRARPFHR
jgi:hypothetical protein